MSCDGNTISISYGEEQIRKNTLITFAGVISGYMLEVFLYSINLLIFSIAAYTLVYNLKGYARWVLLGFAISMFVISTVAASLSLYIFFGCLMHEQAIPFRLLRARHVSYFVNNLIADILLIYRCYVIWSRSILVIIAPCICLLASLRVFYVQSPQGDLFVDRRYIYIWMALGFNIVVTVLNASRIWWLSREVRKVLGPTLTRKYYSAMVIIIESGAIYSLYVLISQLIKTVVDKNLIILDAGLTQVVSIAPTLIIVQVGLGRQARDLESAIQTTREFISTTAHSH
ncbi:hypothetical protein D9756_007156 [Leucocoprinus leucothites]|uniref:Uncharacterized protein n=1 Tax=Leucocoprinus leucothites TaxID=201217 RepID=A0A8H5FYS4_9AGAR|nr:hypothetical protein D9756_007156 [Leucoagaricus leucothites]